MGHRVTGRRTGNYTHNSKTRIQTTTLESRLFSLCPRSSLLSRCMKLQRVESPAHVHVALFSLWHETVFSSNHTLESQFKANQRWSVPRRLRSDPHLSRNVSQPSMSEDETGSAERQFAIWRSRVHREFENCDQPHALPDGVTLQRTYVDEASGRCEGEFHCFVPFQEGSEALALIPLTSLVVSMSFDRDRVARGKTQFPFLTPQVRVRIGHLYLPTELLKRVERVAKDQTQADSDSRYAYMLRMPMLSQWTPSNTLVMLMHEFVKMVQQVRVVMSLVFSRFIDALVR